MLNDPLTKRGRHLRAEAKAAAHRAQELCFQSQMLRIYCALRGEGLEGMRDTMRVAMDLQREIVQLKANSK